MGRHTLLAVATTLLAVLTVPSVASAGVQLALSDGTLRPQPYQRWADAAAAPGPTRTVTLHMKACPGGPSWAGGCALPQGQAVYMLPHAAGPHILLHELGHVFDATALTHARRRGFQRIVGRPGPWSGPPEADPPMEQFAEAYSLCARRSRIADREFAMYAYSPSPDQHGRVCALIRRASGSSTARPT
jgi:hypothetical protein